MVEQKNAVVLLSGGLDSTTCLAYVSQQRFRCYALSIEYGQRHRAELNLAKKIASDYGCIDHRVIEIDVGQFGGSALTDEAVDIPVVKTDGIPVTYVPARNTMMLAVALGWAEVINAKQIFVGVNAVDYSGYPDCRPEYIAAFNELARLATKVGVEAQPITVHAPLQSMSKAEIITLGTSLNVDYARTVSCYQADGLGRACGQCDSCRLRRDGFHDAGIDDPTRYVSNGNA